MSIINVDAPEHRVGEFGQSDRDMYAQLAGEGSELASAFHRRMEFYNHAHDGATGRFTTTSSTGAALQAAVGKIRPVTDALHSAGGRSFLVGGIVRDAMLGQDNKDIDIEVHGLSTDQIADTLARFGKLDLVGKSFGVFKLQFNGEDLDISVPRRESKTGVGHKDFQIEVDPTMTTADAAGRRDFTIGSIMYDVDNKKFVDHYGGQVDLEAGTIRHTTGAFSEDELRVLRGVRFASRFGFEIAPETRELSRTMTPAHLPAERIWGEFEKMTTKGDFGIVQKELAATGWSEHFPTVARADANAVTDIIKSGREDRGMLVLARLAHDGVDLNEIGAPQTLRQQATKLAETELPDNVDHFTALQTARALAPLTLEQLAVSRGRTDLLPMARELTVPKPLIDGDMLIKLGMRPGPKFKSILSSLLLAQDSGQIKTTEEGIALLRAGGEL